MGSGLSWTHRQWRASKVRPLQGSSPHDRLVSRGMVSLRNACDVAQPATVPLSCINIEAPRYAFSRHCGIYQSDVGLGKPSLDWSGCLPPTTPDPSPRTRREERVLLIVLMSSDRLFLDRVGRHQSSSPLHRHAQTNTHFLKLQVKGDISTLPAIRHFYFALTDFIFKLDWN
jgi:hypothetical protein